MNKRMKLLDDLSKRPPLAQPTESEMGNQFSKETYLVKQFPSQPELLYDIAQSLRYLIDSIWEKDID